MKTSQQTSYECLPKVFLNNSSRKTLTTGITSLYAICSAWFLDFWSIFRLNLMRDFQKIAVYLRYPNVICPDWPTITHSCFCWYLFYMLNRVFGHTVRVIGLKKSTILQSNSYAINVTSKLWKYKNFVKIKF